MPQSSPDPNYSSSTDHPQSIDSPNSLNQTVQDLRVETARLNQEVSQLQGRSHFLISLLVGLLLLLGGLGVWFTLRLQSLDQQTLLESAESAGTEKLAELEQEIEALRQQLPENLTKVEQRSQDLIRKLETQLAEIETKLNQSPPKEFPAPAPQSPAPTEPSPSGETSINDVPDVVPGEPSSP